jgi:hypothetical protein
MNSIVGLSLLPNPAIPRGFVHEEIGTQKSLVVQFHGKAGSADLNKSRF